MSQWVWIVEHRETVKPCNCMDSVVMFVASTQEKAVAFIQDFLANGKKPEAGWYVVTPDPVDEYFSKNPPAEVMNATGTHRIFRVFALDGTELENQPV
jgi:hypothetical protein